MNAQKVRNAPGIKYILPFAILFAFLFTSLCAAQGNTQSSGTGAGESPAFSAAMSRSENALKLNDKEEILSVFKAAGEDYRQGRYDEAASNYLRIYNTGIKNHILFYNLGNCYYRLNRVGLAMLMWEKGLKLEPKDALLEANIGFASKKLYDKFETEDTHFIGAMIGAVSRMLSSEGWVILTIIFFWTAGICLILFQTSAKNVIRRIAGYAALLFIFLFIVSAVFMVAYYYSFTYEKEGILLIPAVQVRSGPGMNNPVLFILHEGTKVNVESEQPDWFHISVPNGYNGWIPARAVGII